MGVILTTYPSPGSPSSKYRQLPGRPSKVSVTEEVDHLVPLLTGFGRIFFLKNTFGMFCVLGVSTKNKMGGCEAELSAVFGVFVFLVPLGRCVVFLFQRLGFVLCFSGGSLLVGSPCGNPPVKNHEILVGCS